MAWAERFCIDLIQLPAFQRKGRATHLGVSGTALFLKDGGLQEGTRQALWVTGVLNLPW